MININQPTGLIRYASENSITKGVKLKFDIRMKAYSLVLLLLLSLLAFLMLSRSDVDVTLMRVSGLTYQKQKDGTYSNLYNLKLANKTHRDIPITLHLENIKGEIMPVGSSNWIVKKEDYSNMEFFVKLDVAELHGWKTEFKIAVMDGDKKIKSAKAKFIGPEVYK
jgi:polyferredoxin